MDIELLKTFLELSRTRHFGRAAENLFISQSAVSARIRQLEDSIGAPLFTRDRNNIRLTTVGEKMVRHAESIVLAWGRIRQDVVLQDTLTDSLTVAGVPSLWDIFLQKWLQRMYETCPTTAIHAETLAQEQLLRQVLDGSVDLGFSFESPQLDRLQVDEVLRFDLIMVSSKPRVSAQQAVAGDYLLVNWGTSFATAHVRHFPHAPPPRLHVGVGRIAYEFLLQQGGAAYLAEPTVRTDIKAKRLHLVDDAPVIHRSVFGIYSNSGGKRGESKTGGIDNAIGLARQMF